MRMELYVAATNFVWGALADHTSQGPVGTAVFCNKTMTDLMPAFEAWTPGFSGDGTIFMTKPHLMPLGDTAYTLTAYQRRRCVMYGMLVKRLVCFVSTGAAEKCCVSKSAVALDRGTWDQQTTEVKLT